MSDFFNLEDLEAIENMSSVPDKEVRKKIEDELYPKKKRRAFIWIFPIGLLGMIMYFTFSNGNSKNVVHAELLINKQSEQNQRGEQNQQGEQNIHVKESRLAENEGGNRLMVSEGASSQRTKDIEKPMQKHSENAYHSLPAEQINRGATRNPRDQNNQSVDKSVAKNSSTAIRDSIGKITPAKISSLPTLAIELLESRNGKNDSILDAVMDKSSSQKRKYHLAWNSYISLGIQDRRESKDVLEYSGGNIEIGEFNRHLIGTELMFGVNITPSQLLSVGVGFESYKSRYTYEVQTINESSIWILDTSGVLTNQPVYDTISSLEKGDNTINYLTIPIYYSFNFMNRKKMHADVYMGLDQMFLVKDNFTYSEGQAGQLKSIVSDGELNKYRIALRVGMSFKYSLTDRVMLNSGIMFKYGITPTLRKGDRLWNYHSIGVNLGLTYSL